jgi:hypothetical protein
MNSFEILFRLVDYLLIAMEVPILYLLLRRRLYRDVPWFAIYIAFQIVSTAAIYFLHVSGDRIGNFFAGWTAEGISVTLSFVVILEAFRNSVVQYRTVRRFGIAVLLTAAIISVVIAFVLLPYGTRTTDQMMRFIQVTERSLRIIQLGVLVSMFALASYLAITWRHYVFGIVVGYGLYAAANLSAMTYLAYLGGAGHAQGATLGRTIAYLDSGAYCCAVAIWLVYLLQQERMPAAIPRTAEEDLSNLEAMLPHLRGPSNNQTEKEAACNAKPAT